MLGVHLSRVLFLSLSLSLPLKTSSNLSFCAKVTLKLLNQHNLPREVPGLGEAVSEVVSPTATAGEGRVCWMFPFTSPWSSAR